MYRSPQSTVAVHVHPDTIGLGKQALVAARWAAAERRRAPGLSVPAGAMSRPILKRCGLESVCELELSEDVGISG